MQTYLQENALGSAVLELNSTGGLVSRREYDAYGQESNILVGTNTPFRFAGKHGYQTDLESGFDLLEARFYLPGVGRFLTQDPIGQKGGLNLYAYCGNGPLSKVDPDGTQDGPVQARDSVTANPTILQELIQEGVIGQAMQAATRTAIAKHLAKFGLTATAHGIYRIMQRADDVRTVVDIMRSGGGYFDPITDTNVVYSNKYKQGIILDRKSGEIITILTKGKKSPRWIATGRDVIDKLLKKR